MKLAHLTGAQRRADVLIALQAGQGVVGSMSIPVQARAGEPKEKHRNRGAFLFGSPVVLGTNFPLSEQSED